MMRFTLLALAITSLAQADTPLLESYCFQGDERVLEISCGDGTQTASIAQRLPDGFVLGIDSSEADIRRAITTYDLDFFANIEFQAVQADELPYTGYFDLVVADEEGKRSLMQIARVLRPGGQLILSLPVNNALEETIADALASPKWAPYVLPTDKSRHLASAEEYRQLLRAAGFSPQKVELVDEIDSFSERDELVSWIAAQLYDQLQLPLEGQRALASEIADLYLVQAPNSATFDVIRPTLHLQAIKVR